MDKEKKELLRRERQIRARALLESGYSIEEISKALGVSETVVKAILKIRKDNSND